MRSEEGSWGRAWGLGRGGLEGRFSLTLPSPAGRGDWFRVVLMIGGALTATWIQGFGESGGDEWRARPRRMRRAPVMVMPSRKRFAGQWNGSASFKESYFTR